MGGQIHLLKQDSLDTPHLLLTIFFLYGVINGCAPTLSPVTPPENYKGPIAEGPVLRPGDYWIYERGDRRKIQVGAGTFLGNPRFPLWVGKTWSYQGEALRAGQPQTSQASRLTTDIQCYVAGYGKITVAAGTFEALSANASVQYIARDIYRSVGNGRFGMRRQ